MKRADIELLLPEVFRRTIREGAPLATLLDIMEAFHASPEKVLSELDITFNPYMTQDKFVPFLAMWVDLERVFDRRPHGQHSGLSPTVPIATGLGRLRELITAAAFLSQWRGTRKGLLLFLETATGLSGFSIDDKVLDSAGKPQPFHLHITASEEALPYQSLIERIIEMEKPAYVTFQLEFKNLSGKKVITNKKNKPNE